MLEVTKALIIYPTVNHTYQLSDGTSKVQVCLGGPCFVAYGSIIEEHSFII